MSDDLRKTDPVAWRWNLHYEIVEAYTREFKKLPDITAVYQGIAIGKWLAAQRERSNLGLLPANDEIKMNELDRLVSDLNPSPWLGIVPALPRIPPRPARTYPRPAASKPKPVAPKPKPMRDTHGKYVSVPHPDNPNILVPKEHAYSLKASGTVSQETKENTNMSNVAKADYELINAVTDFYNSNGHLPQKKDRHITAGGRSITNWTWDLTSKIANEKIDDTVLFLLKQQPWWSIIEERVDKYRAKNAIPAAPSADNDQPAVEEVVSAEPGVETVSEEAVSAEPAVEAEAVEESVDPTSESATTDESPSAEAVEETSEVEAEAVEDAVAPEDKGVYISGRTGREIVHPYKRDHTSNPLARQARDERESAERVASENATVDQLPEVALLAIADEMVVAPIKYRVEVSRNDLTLANVSDAVSRLARHGLDARAARTLSTTGNTYRLYTSVVVTDLESALPRLTDAGYIVDKVELAAKI